MPGLLELQRTFGAALLAAPRAACCQIAGLDPLLLGIYRNTCHSTLTNALALSFPAVRKLVGPEFFEGVAREFLSVHPPHCACLSDYGEEFPAFVAGHAQARTLPYLADVSRLEWAFTRALHAPDPPAMAVSALAGLDPASMPAVRFVPHPAVSLLVLATPADAIWRAVLEEDAAAMRALDVAAGPVWLLIERTATEGLRVQRMAAAAARLTQSLLAGEPLQIALEAAASPDELEPVSVLAEHLASGCLIGWRIA